MQTFLPYVDFEVSALALDRQRLGKQRVEVLQLLKALKDGGAWSNHPAARMWRGHEGTLITYGRAMCDAWIARGYKDTCRDKITAFDEVFDTPKKALNYFRAPAWLGDEAFHASHRSNLLRKDPEWYGRFGWTENSDLPYVWPVNISG